MPSPSEQDKSRAEINVKVALCSEKSPTVSCLQLLKGEMTPDPKD